MTRPVAIRTFQKKLENVLTNLKRCYAKSLVQDHVIAGLTDCIGINIGDPAPHALLVVGRDHVPFRRRNRTAIVLISHRVGVRGRRCYHL